MDKIVVCDNFLDEEEIKKAVDIIEKKSWQFGHVSNGGKKPDLIETPFWSTNLNEDEFFSVYLKEVIERHFQRKFKLDRVYANGQTFGQDGTFHTDNDKENTFSFCLYLGRVDKKYTEIAGGYIYFKLPGNKFDICYEPLFNRGLLFPSNYLHKSTSYSRYVMNMRICVAWKMEEII